LGRQFGNKNIEVGLILYLKKCNLWSSTSYFYLSTF